MIARVWRGHTRSEDADAYAAFLEKKGFSDYRETQGNRGSLLFRRVGEGTAEFILVSFWEDLDAVRRFAGPDAEKAVYYPEDEHFLLGKEPRVTHYELAASMTDPAALEAHEARR